MSFSTEKGNAQSVCDCGAGCSFGLSPINMCDLTPDSQGPYYVKVYLYFVVPTNEPGAFSYDPLATRAATIWNNLSSAFSEHYIFFVPGFGACNASQTYQEITSNTLPDNGNGVEVLRNLGYKHTDGIDVYIFKDTEPIGKADALCVPSDHIYLIGVQDNTVLSKSQTISHEIGHCLGLIHTSGISIQFCIDTGTDCQHTGDFVCDTPPDNESYSSTNTSCTPDPLPSADYLNFMSYFQPHTCRNHFTVGQGQRMRRYLNENIGTVAQVRLQDIVITGHTQWFTATTVSANIIIEPGGQLDIYAPVTMHENAYIYVKTSTTGQLGGTLNVYSLITADCDKMWEGIVVDGRQSPGQQTQSQGRASVYAGGIIEHALCGIRAQGRDQTGAWQPFATGGIVTTFKGIFRNNLLGIHLSPYYLTNHSYIYFTQFMTTDAFRGGSPSMPRHVFLDGVSNVKVFGCSFSDERTDPYTVPATRYSGIVANNAGFYIRPLGATAAVFNGLFEGVHISQISEFDGNHIFGAQFTGCFTGIRSYNNNNYTFEGNIFSMQRPANYTGPLHTAFTGIDMQGGSTAFQVRGNYFNNIEVNFDDVLVGTKAYAVTKDDRSIASNTYFNMHKGNVANGQNGFTMGELLFSGLMYECNTFMEDFNHDNIVESGIVRKEQGPRGPQSDGFPRISSGNLYTGAIFDQQFTNTGTQAIEYHHRLGTPEELLSGHFSVGTVTSIVGIVNLTCGTNPECPNPPCAAAKLSNIKTQFINNKQLWSAKMSAFPASASPALQDSEAIVINGLRHELDLAGNTIILHYALDTTEVQTDSILAWMAQLQTYNSDLQLAKYRFFKGNFAAADTLLQHIPLQYSLDTDLQAEFNDIKAVLQTIRPNIQAGEALSALPAATADSLEINWGTACSAAGALARDLLYQNGRLLEANCVISGQRPTSLTQTKASLATPRTLKIYPNPASTSLNIERANTKETLLLRITDLSLAKIVMERRLPEEERAITLDISQLNSGIYLVSYQGSATYGQIKLVVSH